MSQQSCCVAIVFYGIKVFRFRVSQVCYIQILSFELTKHKKHEKELNFAPSEVKKFIVKVAMHAKRLKKVY